MTEIPYSVVDLDEHPEIMLVEDCTINVAEVFYEKDAPISADNGYMKCLFLTLSGSSGATVQVLVPTESAFGQAILNGDLELLSKKCLDKVT